MSGEAVLPASMAGMRIHFVGVKGTGMAALVEILAGRGAELSGSDVAEKFYTDEILKKCGLEPTLFDAKNITDKIQLVIYSSAYSPEKNPELAEAARLGIPCILYSKALGLVSKEAFGCGICGVHGKTTTTGLAGTILKELDLPAQVLAGSVISSFGGSCTYTSPCGTKYFVAETCEYQRHFMDFFPKKIVLTSVESDHQDYYPTFADIQSAFSDYIRRLPEGGQVIFCADDKGASETVRIALEARHDIQAVPYGEAADSPYRLEFGESEPGVQNFSVSSLGKFRLRVPGRHLVLNAAGALALCAELLKSEGKNPADYIRQMQRGVEAFCGGRRRSEVIGRAKTKEGVPVEFIDDYGHHPTAIRATLQGYREFYAGRKIIVDFMSHTYSRTAALLDEFASSFGAADFVVLNKIYASAREDSGAAGITGETLAERTRAHHPHVSYQPEFDGAAREILCELEKPLPPECTGFLVVTMGAGDNWKVGRQVLEALGGTLVG